MAKSTQSNDSWHSQMYDLELAQSTIGSKTFQSLAVKEVKFLITALKLKKGSEILDIPCGTGRHTAVFANLGMKVTGLDINNSCLKLARDNCRLTGVRLRRADMSKLALYREKFDAVVNLFTSFGYFSTDAKNKSVLKELISTLKPGGQIALHVINRDWLLDVFRPIDWNEKNGVLTLEVRKYNPETKCNEAIHVTVNHKSGKIKSNYHRIRLYSKTEMVALMRNCGLKDIQVYGDFKGGPFRKSKSSHPIYIARKP